MPAAAGMVWRRPIGDFRAMETALNSILRDLPAGAAAPEFVHLLPTGRFSGADGRGPYEIQDVEALLAASLQGGRKLPIDINHAIDLRGKDGDASPAVGWIIGLEQRADGVWGKVEWTEGGKSLIDSRAYGFLSPVFHHTKTKPHKVVQLLRAALTNDPNLTLTALHNRKDQSMEKELREALGLPETADREAILAAVTAARNASTSSLAILARATEAAGVKADATADELVTAINTKREPEAKGDDAEKAALQEQVKSLATRLDTVVTTHAREKAVAVVDAAIADGRLVPALRDDYVARHRKEPGQVEKELKLMPSLNAGGLGNRRPVEAGDGVSIEGTDAEVVALMGIDPKAFAETSKLVKEAL